MWVSLFLHTRHGIKPYITATDSMRIIGENYYFFVLFNDELT